MKRALFFDCDGVLVESGEIKTRAFARLFDAWPDKRDEIVAYHLSQAGISRFVKFRHIHAHILGLPLSDEETVQLGKAFSRLVMEEVLKAPLVDGVVTFLEGCPSDVRCYVISGTPQDELDELLEKRDLARFFVDIIGSPTQKPDAIRAWMVRDGIAVDEAVMIGDGESDWRAAQETGIDFVARVTDENRAVLGGCTWALPDLSGLEDMLNSMNQGAKRSEPEHKGAKRSEPEKNSTAKKRRTEEQPV
ncbi:MAG: HAD family hydrolase [Magnetococcales bacterium]|nr:HAD family hydrolase [Magnetococcales bacterium]